MTIFAVICAGMFPGIHVGRLWLATGCSRSRTRWACGRTSAARSLWDVFAVGTYFTVSLLFWYMGMIPDLATLRDRATSRVRQIVYGVLALGWRGSNRHWHRYERAYLILAALATPLVLSVHSVVSFDFAVVDGPGLAHDDLPAVLRRRRDLLRLRDGADCWPCRRGSGSACKDIITLRHLENMNKIMLATGMMVGYAYAIEFFIAWYCGQRLRAASRSSTARFGPYAWAYWIDGHLQRDHPAALLVQAHPHQRRGSSWCIVRVRQRRHVVRALRDHRDLAVARLPAVVAGATSCRRGSSCCTLAGSFGLFFTLFLLFCRFLPMVAMAEVKAVMPQAQAHETEPERPGRTLAERRA